MVKRGLDPIQKPKKRRFRILLATGREDVIDRIIITGLKEKAGNKYDFEFITAFRAGEILKLAQTHEFNMFVLFLNNIPFHLDNSPLHMDNSPTIESRLNRALQLVTHLKTTYRKPVMALSGIDLKEEQVKKAGADFYFLMPSEPEELFEAIVICLNRLSNNPALDV